MQIVDENTRKTLYAFMHNIQLCNISNTFLNFFYINCGESVRCDFPNKYYLSAYHF